MKVIIKKKPNNSLVWYYNHIDEIIDVELVYDDEFFPAKSTYKVIGPSHLIEKYKEKSGWDSLGIAIEDVEDLRLKKLERLFE